jgi:hypothetical protein
MSIISKQKIWQQCQLYAMIEKATSTNGGYGISPHNTKNEKAHWDSYTRALLVSKDRRHLFETPCFKRSRLDRFKKYNKCLKHGGN